MANELKNLDLSFYRQSQNLKARLMAALIALGKGFESRRDKNSANWIYDTVRFVNKSSVFLNDGCDCGVCSKGIRFWSAIFRDTRIYVVMAAVQHVLNRWQHFIHKDKSVTGKQMERGIRYLENLHDKKVYEAQIFHSNSKGQTFDLRKFLR
ncbi:MAG: hypothetical protein WC554_10625 [Clostridia bacterium]